MYKNKIVLITFAASVLVAIITLNFSAKDTNTEAVSDDEYHRAFLNDVRIFSPHIPESMEFCGEPVPLEMYHVYERLDREIMVNTYWQSNILLLIKRANRFFPIIEPILKEQGLPDDFKYLALAESAFTNIVSTAGAAGFWQFLKGTATQYGLEVNNDIDERYNLEKSTVAAAKYLKANYDRFGKNWTVAAAAYNTGDGNIRRHIETQQVTSYYDMHLPEETMRYVFRILALKTILENPQNYGIIVRKKDMYPVIPVKTIVVDTAVTDLFAFAQQQNVTYQQLKMLNPWLRSSVIPNRSRKKYHIQLPLNQALSRRDMLIMDDDYENIFRGFQN